MGIIYVIIELAILAVLMYLLIKNSDRQSNGKQSIL